MVQVLLSMIVAVSSKRISDGEYAIFTVASINVTTSFIAGASNIYFQANAVYGRIP